MQSLTKAVFFSVQIETCRNQLQCWLRAVTKWASMQEGIRSSGLRKSLMSLPPIEVTALTGIYSKEYCYFNSGPTHLTSPVNIWPVAAWCCWMSSTLWYPVVTEFHVWVLLISGSAAITAHLSARPFQPMAQLMPLYCFETAHLQVAL